MAFFFIIIQMIFNINLIRKEKIIFPSRFVLARGIDISIEMETSLDMQSVAGTESSFKYPKEPLVEIEDHVCTIENMMVPPPPPPPSAIVKITTRSCH